MNETDAVGAKHRATSVASPRRSGWRAYLASACVVAISAAVGAVVVGRSELADVVMVFLLGIVIVALRLGRGPSFLAAALSVIAYDFFFVPPFASLYVTNPRHLVTFGVMFLVAIVISRLMTRLNEHAEAARAREVRTVVLYALSRDLARAPGVDAIVTAAARHIDEVFGSQATILIPKGGDNLVPIYESVGLTSISLAERRVAHAAWQSRQRAGFGTLALPNSLGLYVPLVASRGIVGVMGLYPHDRLRFSDPEQRHLIDTFAAQMAAAIERAQLAEQAEAHRVQVDTEQLRNALLSSVSHDLRTPLAIITGAASTLLKGSPELAEQDQQALLKSVYDESDRLNRLIGNLLDMTRLEAGTVSVKREWYPIDEIIGVAINRTEQRLGDREIRVTAEPELAAPLDGLLVEQALVNLLENAAKYTPEGTPVDISVRKEPGRLFIDISDRGPGFLAGEEERVFEKFYRGHGAGAQGGAGLGLAIAQAIAKAHGGDLFAKQRTGGGAVFTLVLPIEGEPPAAPSSDLEPLSPEPAAKEHS